VRRRRECETCTHRFTTFERRAPSVAIVSKRDGRKEEFDAEKLRAGLERAAHKLPAAEAAVPRIAEIVELEAATGGVLPSKRIGELCLEGLMRADRVAYVRFASVHKQLDSDAIRDELVALGEPVAKTPIGEAANGDKFNSQTDQAEPGHTPDSGEQTDGRIHA
jgi:transcriptional repressor NrdR